MLVANVNDYFSTEIFKGVSSSLRKKGYTAVMLDSNNDLKNELEMLLSISTQHIFGGIILQPLNTNLNLLEENLFNNISTVVVDREIEKGLWSSVVTDNFYVSQKACKYFKNQGLKNAIVLTNQIKGISTREQRFSGIKSIYGKDIQIIKPGNTKFSQDEAYQLLKKMLVKNPNTLIFALKEKWLLEYLPKLINENVLNDNKPTQITGFSDTNFSYIINDKVKLIKQNPFVIGESATNLLLDDLKNENKVIPQKVIIPAEF